MATTLVAQKETLEAEKLYRQARRPNGERAELDPSPTYDLFTQVKTDPPYQVVSSSFHSEPWLSSTMINVDVMLNMS